MTNIFFYPKEAEKELSNLINNGERGHRWSNKNYDLAEITFFMKMNKKKEKIVFAEVHIPLLGSCFVASGNALYDQLKEAVIEKTEEEVYILLDALLESIKEDINVFALYQLMQLHAKRQGENASIAMKWEMQRKFRELIGIEE